MVTTIGPWIYFNAFILGLLALDIFVIHKDSRAISMRESLGWSLFWISLAMLFNLGIYIYAGMEPALNFLTGYLIEKSLSVDNLFVFLMIFSYFKTPAKLQHKVLFWGILGAIFMRAAFIAAGISLVHHFEHILYLFAVFLIYAGIKMAMKTEEDEIKPQQNVVLKLVRRFVPITEDYVGKSFFVIRNNRIWATPLFAVLMLIETTDVIFALDSIPAILAITQDPFIVYTSNIFAVMGLRALFFVLADLLRLFHYLHYALAFILSFIGTKMLIAKVVEIPTPLVLSITLAALLIAIFASMLFPAHNPPPRT